MRIHCINQAEYTAWRKWAEGEGLQVGEHLAIVPQSILDLIPQYDCTTPTGVYYGKVWKSNRRAFFGDKRAPGLTLHEYQMVPGKPNLAKVHSVPILVPNSLQEAAFA